MKMILRFKLFRSVYRKKQN